MSQEPSPKDQDVVSFNPLDRFQKVREEAVRSFKESQGAPQADDGDKPPQSSKSSDDVGQKEPPLKADVQEVGTSRTEREDKKLEDPPKDKVGTSRLKGEEEGALDQKKLEELQKRLVDSQRYATKAHQAIKSIKTKLAEMVESGDLEEETSKNLLESLTLDVSFSEPKAFEKKEKTPLDAVTEVLTPDVIQNYLEFSEDQDYSKKIFAFQAYYDELSQEEQKELVSDILDQKTPLKILKKILGAGEENLKSEYGEIIAAGSPKKYAIAQKEKIKKLERDIEKLHKKLSQYEDFDKPTLPVSPKETSFDNTNNRTGLSPVAMMDAKKRELGKIVANYQKSG